MICVYIYIYICILNLNNCALFGCREILNGGKKEKKQDFMDSSGVPPCYPTPARVIFWCCYFTK